MSVVNAMRVVKALVVAMLVSLIGPQPVCAHPMQQSLVDVRVQDRVIRLHLVLPSVELVYALIEEGTIPRPPPGFERYPDAAPDTVRRYVRRHLAVTDRGGRVVPFVVAAVAPPLAALPDGAPEKDWLVDVDIDRPAGAAASPLALHYGVITREVFNHVAILSLVEDWSAGILPGHPEVIGQVQRGEQVVTITPGVGRNWRAWLEMIALGMGHIADGPDHQAFLLAVLLTVGLVARNARWQAAGKTRRTLHDTLWRTGAFTLGHSLSLAATSLGWLPPGGKSIEVLIAVSVALSALHALVPIYPGREGWIAAAFGLIHGMAFATTIRDMALPTSEVLAATLGFNIGIEFAQLALVALVLPVLLFVRRWRRAEAIVRTIAALAVLGLSVVWIAQRV